MRNVVVDDQGDALDVEAAGCDVGGDEDVDLAFAEHVDRALTGLLGDVAVDRRGLEPTSTQLLRQLFGRLLGAHEHDDALVLLDLEDAGQGIELVGVLDHEVALADVRAGLRLRCDADLFGVVEVLAGQAVDRGRHGRGEERHLTRIAGLTEDLLDVLGEAHLEHLVGLVEDEVLEAAELEGALLEVVDDATGGADDDLGSALESGQLRAVGLSAVDGEDGEVVEVRRIGGERLGDLDRELAGRGEHEGEGAVVGTTRLGEVGQGRQRERCGLAGAGLGQADDVAAIGQRRNGRRLDRCRGLVALSLDGLEDERVQVQLGEFRCGRFVGRGHIGHEFSLSRRHTLDRR